MREKVLSLFESIRALFKDPFKKKEFFNVLRNIEKINIKQLEYDNTITNFLKRYKEVITKIPSVSIKKKFFRNMVYAFSNMEHKFGISFNDRIFVFFYKNKIVFLPIEVKTGNVIKSSQIKAYSQYYFNFLYNDNARIILEEALKKGKHFDFVDATLVFESGKIMLNNGIEFNMK